MTFQDSTRTRFVHARDFPLKYLQELDIKLFRTLTTLVQPKKAEFTKRLIAKRQDLATDSFLVGFVGSETAQNHLRTLGLRFIEYAVTPEATVVNVLEQYWPLLRHFGGLANPYAIRPDAERSTDWQRILNTIIGQIEYQLTGRPNAAAKLPDFSSLEDYMRYRLRIEHPKEPRLTSEDGFSKEFFAYAIQESKYVFGR